jgi:hypothetical protein
MSTPLIVSFASVPALALPTGAGAATPVPDSAVDAMLSSWSAATPGCAAGVSDDGRIVLERAYGLADLEHGAPNRPDTVFEAGSVSKHFTAAILVGGIDKSRALASHLEAVAAETGAEFLDVGAVTSADGVDGIHLSEAAHRKIGLAVADKIRAILE